MARRKTLSEYLESLPDDCAAVRVRVGDNNNPGTTAVVALPAYKSKDNQYAPLIVEDAEQLAQVVEAEAHEAGWPEEHPVLRLHAYTATGGQLPTFSRTAGPPQGGTTPQGSSPEWAIIGRLVDGYLAFGGEMRRTVDILTETLAHRETIAADAMESALAARQDAQDAEMQAYASQLVADELAAAEGGGGLEGAAGEMLATLIQQFTPQAGPQYDPPPDPEPNGQAHPEPEETEIEPEPPPAVDA